MSVVEYKCELGISARCYNINKDCKFIVSRNACKRCYDCERAKEIRNYDYKVNKVENITIWKERNHDFLQKERNNRNEYQKQWKQNNPDKVKQYKQNSYDRGYRQLPNRSWIKVEVRDVNPGAEYDEFCKQYHIEDVNPTDNGLLRVEGRLKTPEDIRREELYKEKEKLKKEAEIVHIKEESTVISLIKNICLKIMKYVLDFIRTKEN